MDRLAPASQESFPMRLALLCLCLVALGSQALGAGPDDRAREKELREALEEGLSDDDPANRRAALDVFDQASRELPPSRLVVRALAEALQDDDLDVRTRALRALGHGREVDTTLEVLAEALDDLRGMMERAATVPGARDDFNAASRTYAQAVLACAAYRDDRAVDDLVSELGFLVKRGTPGSMSRSLVAPLVQGLLHLGSREAVEAVVDATNDFAGSTFARGMVGNSRVGTAKVLHEGLAALAREREEDHEVPVFDETFDQGWAAWWDAHEDDFPKSLGKLRTPPEQPVTPRKPERQEDPFRRHASGAQK